MTKFYNVSMYLAHFWSAFPILGAKEIFPEDQFCRAQLHMGF